MSFKLLWMAARHFAQFVHCRTPLSLRVLHTPYVSFPTVPKYISIPLHTLPANHRTHRPALHPASVVYILGPRCFVLLVNEWQLCTMYILGQLRANAQLDLSTLLVALRVMNERSQQGDGKWQNACDWGTVERVAEICRAVLPDILQARGC